MEIIIKMDQNLQETNYNIDITEPQISFPERSQRDSIDNTGGYEGGSVPLKKKFNKSEYSKKKHIEKYNKVVDEVQNEYLQLSDEKKILLFNEFIFKFPFLCKDLVSHYVKSELSDLLKLI